MPAERRRAAGFMVAALVAVGLTGMAAAPARAAVPVTSGVPVTVTLAAGGSSDHTFTGSREEQVTLDLPATFGALDGLTASLLRPDGSTRSSQVLHGTGAPARQPLPLLDAAGTWTLRFTAPPGAAGSFPVTVHLAPVKRGVITPGTPRPVTLAEPGQRIRLTFTGVVGRPVVALLDRIVWLAPGQGTLAGRLVRPDGSVLDGSVEGTQVTAMAVTTGRVIDQAGTWVLEIEVSGDFVARFSASVDLVPDTVVPTAIGTTTPVTLDGRGGNVVLPFTATVGTRLGLTLGPLGALEAALNWSVRRPDGTLLFGEGVGDRRFLVTDKPLDVTGEWAVVLDPSGLQAGSTTVRLNTVTDVSAPLTLGVPMTLDFADPGQVYRLTVPSLAVGRRVAVHLTGGSFSSALAGGPVPALLQPVWLDPTGRDANTAPALGALGVPGWLEQRSSRSGTWTLVLDPFGDQVGTVTLLATKPVDRSLTAVPGVPTKVAIGAQGVNATLPVVIPAGRTRAVAELTAGNWVDGDGGSRGSGTARIGYGAAIGVFLQTDAITHGGRGWAEADLPPGTWKLTVDPIQASVGSSTVVVSTVADQTGTLTSGVPSTVTIGERGVNRVMTFTAKAGQRVSIAAAAQQWSSAVLGSGHVLATLNGPDVQQSIDLGTGPQGGGSWLNPLQTDGPYTLTIDPVADSTGTADITLTVT